MGSRKDVTLKEIAQRVGTSVSTVSRALQEHPSVSATVRRDVRQVATELGYQPAQSGAAAPGLKAVGCVVPSIKVSYYARLVTGILRVSDTYDHGVLLRLSRYDPANEEHQLARLLESGVDGLIVVSFQSNSPALTEAAAQGIPVVHLDRPVDQPNACLVAADESEAAYQATQYLLSLGHGSFLYVAGPETGPLADRRYAGFERALQDAGVQPECCDRLVVSALQVEPTVEAVRARLAVAPAPTAVVASDDLLASGVYAGLRQAGLKVPEDVSIVGLNGNRMSAGIGLTTVMLPAGQMGRSAMQLLIDIHAGRVEPPQRVELNGRLVVRSSCAPPPNVAST